MHHEVVLETHVLVFEVGDVFTINATDDDPVQRLAGIIVQDVIVPCLCVLPDGRCLLLV